MQLSAQLMFPPFRLDLTAEQLWHGEERVALRPKPLAVLRYLAEHSGRLVTQAELRKAVWGNTHVSEAILRVNTRELRAALANNAAIPRLIETVPRRGYRFLVPVQRAISGSDLKSERLGFLGESQFILLGRNTELLQLSNWLTQALNSSCEIVFIAGEVGIGKSSLINTFLEQAAAAAELWIGRSHCVDQRGSSEPYLPLLDLLAGLCNSPDSANAVDILRRHAPSWLTQMPGLISESEFETLRHRVLGVGQERMLREVSEAVEQMSVSRPIIMVLEDLHWSDPSTIAWLEFFARRRRAARVMVIATFREVASLAADHPLRVIAGELAGRYCHEIALRPLNVGEVADDVAHRISADTDGHATLGEIGLAIHRCTEGNPLFVVNVVDTLLYELTGDGGPASRLLAELRRLVASSPQIIPATIGEIITQNFARLNQFEQSMVETASVAGMQFSAAAVAAGAQASLLEVEECCSALANRKSFLGRAGEAEWPDGTVAAKFRFQHSLYREVVYAQVPPTRRAQSHQRIGERMESAYGDNAGDISAELAWHFEQGRDSARAQRYHEIAAQRAWRHAALREAVAHLRAALSIASRLPESPARDQLELELRVGLAAALQNAQGWGSPEVQQMYAIIGKLGNTRTDSRQLFRAGMALWGFAVGRGNWKEAHARAEQNTRLANPIGDPRHIAAARRAGGHGLFFLGRFDEARAHLEQALALAEAIPLGQFNNFTYARNLVSDAASVLSWTLEIAGYSDQALETIARALRAAEEGAHLADLTSVACFTGILYWIRREWPALESWARRCVTLASENSVPYYHALGTVMAGVAAVEQGQSDYGLTLIHEGVSACRMLGTVSALSAMLLGLARAYGFVGKIPEGLEV